MRTVLTYGTFDLLHVGHVRLLKRARAMGDRLVVGVSTDDFCAKAKGKRTVIPFEQRAEIVGALGCVDMVFAEMEWEQKALDVEKYGADMIVMGGDWLGKFDDLPVLVAYLSRTGGVSSTEIKAKL